MPFHGGRREESLTQDAAESLNQEKGFVFVPSRLFSFLAVSL